MTTSPPMERLWIVAAGGGRLERSRHRSSVVQVGLTASPG